MRKIVLTQEQTTDIINLYQIERCSITKIGARYGVSKHVISRVLRENSIEIRKDNHKYQADYRIFETIDSPEKAYWLGFIAADGCVYERKDNTKAGNLMIINISRKDKEHLIKFQNFMKSNVPIIDHIQDAGFSNNTEMSKITFNSNDMVNDLKSIGIVPRKSLILDIPKIDSSLYLPFILGYFDGDGSIFKGNQYNNYGMNIEGTSEILNWINSLLNISTHLEKRKNDQKNNYYIRCGGTNKPYNIMKKLYDSCPVHLDRKYKIFKELEIVVLNSNIK